MVAGLEEALRRSAVIERLPEQPGDVPQTWGDLEKARALLGYEPQTNYPEGVRRFVEWMKTVGS
jgi:UDP-glucuronate 4-epimerase